MNMSLPNELLTELQELRRKPGEWFSIVEIVKRDPELRSRTHFSVPSQGSDVYSRLEDWASRLFERELRLYEVKIAELLSENSTVPSLEDDTSLVNNVIEYIQSSIKEVETDISNFTNYKARDGARSRSKLITTGKRLASELSVTLRLAGEITRLELLENGYEPLDRIGFAHTKIERFYSQYSHIPHPFESTKYRELQTDVLGEATRLLLYVVFHKVNEPRLTGFERKFVSAFMRYLTCSRDSSTSAVEQIASLFEPFLKKIAFLFKVCDKSGSPIWQKGLGDLLSGLNLTSCNLKEHDTSYWQSQTVEDAVFRLAFQLRHKGAHEAHDYTYYERERNAYFVFAALLFSCKILMDTQPDIAKVVEHQGSVDTARDLFVKIDELIYGPDGPRISYRCSPSPPSRLEKLLTFSNRAQGIWPTCSSRLAELLESEYLSVKHEIVEKDREADIESYLDSMRPDDY
ncbi:MAG: hypothetical protein L0220_26065, partial [Acidobacteria bacterium]|nr:hypothetical protein [Acidobacteriota bacterium]